MSCFWEQTKQKEWKKCSSPPQQPLSDAIWPSQQVELARQSPTLLSSASEPTCVPLTTTRKENKKRKKKKKKKKEEENELQADTAALLRSGPEHCFEIADSRSRSQRLTARNELRGFFLATTETNSHQRSFSAHWHLQRGINSIEMASTIAPSHEKRRSWVLFLKNKNIKKRKKKKEKKEKTLTPHFAVPRLPLSPIIWGGARRKRGRWALFFPRKQVGVNHRRSTSH
jgi:hypothetical protein